MKTLLLARVLAMVLLAGTLFAWGNFGYEFVQWRNGSASFSCVPAVANPFLTPCFYGALFFTISFALSMLLLRSLNKDKLL